MRTQPSIPAIPHHRRLAIIVLAFLLLAAPLMVSLGMDRNPESLLRLSDEADTIVIGTLRPDGDDYTLDVGQVLKGGKLQGNIPVSFKAGFFRKKPAFPIGEYLPPKSRLILFGNLQRDIRKGFLEKTLFLYDTFDIYPRETDKHRYGTVALVDEYARLIKLFGSIVQAHRQGDDGFLFSAFDRLLQQQDSIALMHLCDGISDYHEINGEPGNNTKRFSRHDGTLINLLFLKYAASYGSGTELDSIPEDFFLEPHRKIPNNFFIPWSLKVAQTKQGKLAERAEYLTRDYLSDFGIDVHHCPTLDCMQAEYLANLTKIRKHDLWWLLQDYHSEPVPEAKAGLAKIIAATLPTKAKLNRVLALPGNQTIPDALLQ